MRPMPTQLDWTCRAGEKAIVAEIIRAVDFDQNGRKRKNQELVRGVREAAANVLLRRAEVDIWTSLIDHVLGIQNQDRISRGLQPTVDWQLKPMGRRLGGIDSSTMQKVHDLLEDPVSARPTGINLRMLLRMLVHLQLPWGTLGDIPFQAIRDECFLAGIGHAQPRINRAIGQDQPPADRPTPDELRLFRTR